MYNTSHFLDLVFTSEGLLVDCSVSEAADVVVPLDIFHPALHITIANSPVLRYENDYVADRLNFRKTNFRQLRRSLADINWDFLNDMDVDIAVSHYNCILHDCVAASVPKCQPPRKPPWTNATLRNLKRTRARALRTFSNRRCAITKRDFVLASNEYRCYNKFLYKQYVTRTEQNLRCNPKGFWTFVNTKRNETGLPSSMFLDNSTASSCEEKCSLFAKHFSSVFSSDVPSQAEIDKAIRDVPVNVVDMDVVAVNCEMVHSVIRKTKTSFSPGPSIIPSAVLKKCSDILAVPLMKLFNMSLNQHKFPAVWKRSNMFPVFKKGDKRNVQNYRGISSLGVESKVFESLINEKLFASCKHYISNCQHGFFPGRSVETNLVSFTSFCMDNICKKLQVDAVYTDLKAAFDRVNHNILIAKLERIGCSAGFCSWLKSYLIQRQVTVCIGNCSSESFSNFSGVPQGSTLGPLLFSLFVNDVTFILGRGGRLFFADDLKIYIVVRSQADCMELQKLLEMFNDWCTRNLMVLCVPKCCVISFRRSTSVLLFDYTIAGTSLQRVDHVKDLGVVLDEKLAFTRHFSAMIDKANRQLGFMFKISSEFRDPLCFKALYCSLVRSLLEFASVVWSPYQAVWSARLEAVQRRFVRYALQHLPWNDPLNLPPYADRCRLLGLDSLADRRKVSSAVFIAKILLAEYDVPDLLASINLYAPARSLRPRSLLYETPHSTNYAAYSSLNAMIRYFNEVADLFDFDNSSARFRRRLLSYRF